MNIDLLVKLLACAVALALSACGGGSGEPSPQAPPAPPPLAADQSLQGAHVVKLRSRGNAWIALAEKPRAHEDNTSPERHLLLAPAGATATLQYRPPADWSLIDATLHPSGETSLVLATAKRLRLVRLGLQGETLSDGEFFDPTAVGDPMYYEAGPYAHDSSSLLPFPTRDAVRITAAGEGLVMALRTGRQAVIAYGLRDRRPTGYATDWRTVVEPGVELNAEAYRGGGTFDPFGGMENQFHVALDTDAEGRIGIAVSTSRTGLPYGHAKMYGDASVPAGFEHGALLTQLRADGQRLGTAVMDTGQLSELHGLRWSGSRWLLVGRVRSEVRPDGSGWNAFVATVPAGNHRVGTYSVVDIDRGDVFFDAAQLPDGRLLLAGSTGYLQNPSGRSITEEAAPLLVVCDAECRAPARRDVAAGPRHNQLRSLATWAGRWWVGGMEDGAGTHSDDADPSRLRSNGFVRSAAI